MIVICVVSAVIIESQAVKIVMVEIVVNFKKADVKNIVEMN